jgi:hypothetical protein
LNCALAYGDSVTVNLAMKAITRRERPVDVPVNGNDCDTFFNGTSRITTSAHWMFFRVGFWDVRLRTIKP